MLGRLELAIDTLKSCVRQRSIRTLGRCLRRRLKMLFCLHRYVSMEYLFETDEEILYQPVCFNCGLYFDVVRSNKKEIVRSIKTKKE